MNTDMCYHSIHFINVYCGNISVLYAYHSLLNNLKVIDIMLYLPSLDHFSGMKAEAQGVAAQPVGFEAALNSAEGRINFLRSSGQIHPQQPIVAVENFIVEFHSDWYVELTSEHGVAEPC